MREVRPTPHGYHNEKNVVVHTGRGDCLLDFCYKYVEPDTLLQYFMI